MAERVKREWPVEVAPFHGSTILDRLLDAAFDNPDEIERREARRLMQQGAKQYGKTYYVPAAVKRRWALIGCGSVMLGSSLLFLVYVWIAHKLGAI